MKTRNLLIFSLFLLAFNTGIAQVPQGFNYQAIARGSDGYVLQNKTIPEVYFTIQSSTGYIFWKEKYTNLVTNQFGLFTTVVGKGTRQVASNVPTFSALEWDVTPKFLKTEIYYEGTLRDMGTTQLWSVPYSMVADSAQGITSGTKLSVKSDDDDDPTALFEVKRKDGQTVFAVYPFAVNVYVPRTTPKGAKGGFAVGGFDGSKGETPQDYIRITPEGTRVSADVNAKSSKGGFAVGGFDNSKGDLGNYMNMTQENYFIGQESGLNNLTGQFNSFFGYQTGMANKVGNNNVFIGYQSGIANTASNNVFIGNETGFKTTTGAGNVFVGYLTGHENEAGLGNSYVGYRAGFYSTGSQNAFFGYYAGENNWGGSYNLYMGPYAGRGVGTGATGMYNIFLGNYSGQGVTTGQYNSFIGFMSGRNFTSGKGNVFLGYQAGYYADTTSFNVFIGKESGFNNNGGTFNTFLGYNAGRANTLGDRNIFVGYQSGLGNTQGADNVFIGNASGKMNTTGNKNSYLGFEAGLNSLSGNNNTYIGYRAGRSAASSTATDNVMIGQQVGYLLTSGHDNIAIGNLAGYNLTSATYNVLIGSNAGELNQTGNYNTIIGYLAGNKTTAGFNSMIGYHAGYSNISGANAAYLGYKAGYLNTGSNNTFMGSESGYNNAAGSNNVFIGVAAGRQSDGSNNVFIGKFAGYGELGDDQLVIENNYTGADNATNALIYGNFSNNQLRFNSNTSVNMAPNSLYAMQIGLDANDTFGLVVWGSSWGSSAWQTSDIRLKTNIKPLQSALSKVLLLNGVTFNWRTETYPDLGLSNAEQIGFVAQDVEKVLPQTVSEGPGGFKGVEYSNIVPVLVEAIKEQQKMIDELKAEIEQLKKR